MALSSRPRLRLHQISPAQDPSVQLYLKGLTCIADAEQLVRSLQAQPGIKRVELDFGAGRVSVWGILSRGEIARSVRRLGYEPYELDESGVKSRAHTFWNQRTRLRLTWLSIALFALGIASDYFNLSWSGAISNVIPTALPDAVSNALSDAISNTVPDALLDASPDSIPQAISLGQISPALLCYLLAAIVAMLFPLRTAVYAMSQGLLESNALISVVVGGAFAVSAWFDGAIVAVAFAVAEIVEERRLSAARERGRALREALESMKNASAGLVAVKNRFPAQGLITGASLVRVVTPLLMVGALLVALLPPLLLGASFGPWLYGALILLLLARPKGLMMGTPVATMSAVNHALESGIVVKGAAELARLAKVHVVGINKTGTITEGRMTVSDIRSLGDVPEEEILRIAASIEWGVAHPIGTAISEAAQRMEVETVAVTSVVLSSGLGAEAHVDGHRFAVGNLQLMKLKGVDVEPLLPLIKQLETGGKSCIILAEEEYPIGVITLADSVREGSRRAIKRLKRLRGVKEVCILTGDNDGTARHVAQELELPNYRAGLSPADKVRVVEEWKRAGYKVAVVGDGQNDRSILAAADVGIALGVDQPKEITGKVDLAITQAELSKVPYAIVLGRKMLRVIRQNLALAVLAKVLALYLLFSGRLTLGLTAALEMGSSVFIAWNGTKLLKKVRVASR